jgi:hypothetical protein
VCALLAQVKDTIRREYWLFLGRSLESKYGPTAAPQSDAASSDAADQQELS